LFSFFFSFFFINDRARLVINHNRYDVLYTMYAM